MVVNMGSLFDPSMMIKIAKTNRPRLTHRRGLFFASSRHSPISTSLCITPRACPYKLLTDYIELRGYCCNNPAIFLLLFSLDHNPMNTIPLTSRQEYQSPALRVIPIHVENAICDSPIPGGNEDIGYEDWD